jgi:hypothetical protein
MDWSASAPLAFAPLRWGGEQLRQGEKAKLLVFAGFQPARDLFWHRLVAASLP